jgi:hypothetical protein
MCICVSVGFVRHGQVCFRVCDLILESYTVSSPFLHALVGNFCIGSAQLNLYRLGVPLSIAAHSRLLDARVRASYPSSTFRLAAEVKKKGVTLLPPGVFSTCTQQMWRSGKSVDIILEVHPGSPARPTFNRRPLPQDCRSDWGWGVTAYSCSVPRILSSLYHPVASTPR